MLFISFALVVLALWLLEQDGRISIQASKRWFSLLIISSACALFILDYGTMRGIFIFIAVVSIVGTIFTLANIKTDSKIKNS